MATQQLAQQNAAGPDAARARAQADGLTKAGPLAPDSKHAANARAADTAVAQIVSPGFIERYPQYRASIAKLVASSRASQAQFQKNHGVVATLSDKTEAVTETVGEWWHWIRGAKEEHHYIDKHVEMPPIQMWDGVDQALAVADQAFAARDTTKLKDAEQQVTKSYQLCCQRISEFLQREANGAKIGQGVLETVAETAGMVAGFAVGGPLGAAAGAGLVRAGIEAEHEHAAGEKLNWKKIGIAGVKEAGTTLAFSLVAGPVGEKVFKPVLAKALGPALEKVMTGVAAQNIEKYVAGFVAGVGTGTVMNAVQLQVDRLHSGQKMSAGEFGHAVVQSMLQGGAEQLFIDALTHGAGHIAGMHGASAPPEQHTELPSETAHEGGAGHPEVAAPEGGGGDHAEAGGDPQQQQTTGAPPADTPQPKTVQGWTSSEVPDIVGGKHPETEATGEPPNQDVPSYEGTDKEGKRLAQLQQDLARAYPKGYIIKPLNDAASGGVPTSKQNFAKILHGEEGLPIHKEWMEKLLKHPGNYMVQELIDIRTSKAMLSKPNGQHGAIKAFGNVKDEYRVHVVAGHVITNATYHRWSMSKNMLPVSAERTRVEQEIQKMLDRMPAEYKKGTPMALDAAIDTSGNVHVIETNPGGQSGFLAVGRPGGVLTTAPHALYKFVTGRESQAMAGLKSIGTGIMTSLATLNPIAGIAAGIGKYHEARTIKYSSDPEIAAMQKQAHGKLTWVEVVDDGRKKVHGMGAFIGRNLLASDKLVEETSGTWWPFSEKVHASVKRNGHLGKQFADEPSQHHDGAVFVAGDASQALHHKGSLNLAGDVNNILTQEDKLTESATWNKYNPGSVGRAENLAKYMGGDKKTPKAAPVPTTKAEIAKAKAKAKADAKKQKEKDAKLAAKSKAKTKVDPDTEAAARVAADKKPRVVKPKPLTPQQVREQHRDEREQAAFDDKVAGQMSARPVAPGFITHAPGPAPVGPSNVPSAGAIAPINAQAAAPIVAQTPTVAPAPTTTTDDKDKGEDKDEHHGAGALPQLHHHHVHHAADVSATVTAPATPELETEHTTLDTQLVGEPEVDSPIHTPAFGPLEDDTQLA